MCQALIQTNLFQQFLKNLFVLAKTWYIGLGWPYERLSIPYSRQPPTFVHSFRLYPPCMDCSPPLRTILSVFHSSLRRY